MFGRMYSERWAKIGALLVFVGFNVTFFSQFVMGSKGMPRRYFNYLPVITSYSIHYTKLYDSRVWMASWS